MPHPGKYEYCSADLAKYSYYSSVKSFVSMASWATMRHITIMLNMCLGILDQTNSHMKIYGHLNLSSVI